MTGNDGSARHCHHWRKLSRFIAPKPHDPPDKHQAPQSCASIFHVGQEMNDALVFLARGQMDSALDGVRYALHCQKTESVGGKAKGDLLRMAAPSRPEPLSKNAQQQSHLNAVKSG